MCVKQLTWHLPIVNPQYLLVVLLSLGSCEEKNEALLLKHLALYLAHFSA